MSEQQQQQEQQQRSSSPHTEMLMLSSKQWQRVLDHVAREGLLISVDPEELLPHLRRGGLSPAEEAIVAAARTVKQKMAKLEHFLRSRPSLADALRSALADLDESLLRAMDQAVAEAADSEPELDANQFRAALRRQQRGIAVLAEWAVPELVEVGCLAPSDVEDVAGDAQRLVSVLEDKSPVEWRRLLSFLGRRQRDLCCSLRRSYDPSDPVAELGWRGEDVEAASRTHEQVELRFASASASSSDSLGRRSAAATAHAAVNATTPRSETARQATETKWQEIAPRSAPPVDIQLVLSDSRTIVHSVRPCDTVASLVDMLRRGGHLMGVSDIRTGLHGSLMAREDWRRLTMQELGVDQGSSIYVSPVRAASVKVMVFSPEKCLAVEERTVSISETEVADVSAIEKKVSEKSRRPVESSGVTFQAVTVYTRNGRRRQAIRSFDDKKSKYVYGDEFDGNEDVENKRENLVYEFLCHGSGLRAAPSTAPVLHMHPSSEIFAVDDKGALQPAFKSDLLFPSALLLMRGLRLRDPNGATRALMLTLYGDEVVNVDSGDVYADFDTATASIKKEKLTWSSVFILVGPSSLLPRYKIPKDKTVEVFTRSGWDVTVRQRRVTGCATTLVEVGSVWTVAWTPSEFSKDVTALMTWCE